jgi:hypothetical protein
MLKGIIAPSIIITQFLLSACQLGSGMSGKKYFCRIDVKPDIWSYSIVMDFVSNEYVEVKFEADNPKAQTGMAGPQEAPYSVRDGRVTIKSSTGEQIFKIQDDKLISTAGIPGLECLKSK